MSLNVVISSFFLSESKDMGKDVCVTKGNHYYQSTVEEPNNAVEVLDLKSWGSRPKNRITYCFCFIS